MTNLDLSALSGTEVNVERRFLLFQTDLSRVPGLRSVTKFDPGVQSNSGAKSSASQDFKFIDPLEYVDPSDPLYWRYAKNEGYRESFKKILTEYQLNLYTAIRNGIFYTTEASAGGVAGDPIENRVVLRKNGDLPYTDVSRYANTLSGYVSSVSDFGNTLALTLSRPEGETPNDTEFEELNISENDIIMVRVSYDRGQTWKQEFLGFVTDADASSSYGRVRTYNLVVDGLAKFLNTSNIIKQKSIKGQFLAGIETTKTDKTISLYEHEYQGLTTRRIMDTLLDEVLSLEERPVEKTGDPIEFVLSASAFENLGQNKENITFQHSILVLTTLYLMSISKVSNLAEAYTKSTTKGAENDVLDTKIFAILEDGHHKTYNKMVARGFELFFAQLAKPDGILEEIRANTLYDVFETRNGQLICRPPHYNRIELGDGITKPPRTTPWWRGLLERVEIVEDGKETGKYRLEFDTTADYYIPGIGYFDEVVEQNNDADLESRTDVQYTWELVGVGAGAGLPGGFYTDPNLLVKYGLRAKPPISNPNVVNNTLARMFAPIMQGLMNAHTRQFSVTVPDTRQFSVGKLYYLSPSNNSGEPDSKHNPGFVAYLESATINHAYGSVSSQNLSFVLSRQVIQRDVCTILQSENECLDFAMMYLDSPIAAEKNPRKRLIERALVELNALAAANIVSIPMFRYVPSILDLIMEIESLPALIEPDSSLNRRDAEAESYALNRERGGVYTIGESLYSVVLGQSSAGAYEPKKNYGFPEIMKIWETKPDPAAVILSPELRKKYDNPTGLVEYRDLTDNLLYVNKELKFQAVRTPFKRPQIASTENFVFSQLLCNGMAQIDLWGKYVPVSSFTSGARVSGKLSQRYVKASDGLWRLFGQTNPSDFLSQSHVPLWDENGINSVLMFLEDGSGSRFESPIFSLPQAAIAGTTGVFRLPEGDLAVAVPGNPIKPPATWTEPGVGQYFDVLAKLYSDSQDIPLVFLHLSGGEYRIERDPTGRGTTYRINPLGLSTLTTTSGEVFSVKTGAYTLAVTSPLMLLTPYAEMSVERMMEFNLSPGICGYREPSQAAKILQKIPEKIGDATVYTTDSQLHATGRAVKLCPQMILSNSGSDLRFRDGAAEDSVFNTITALVKSTTGVPGVSIRGLPPVDSAVTIKPIYLDGSPVAPVAAKVVTLYVTEDDEKKYAETTRNQITGNFSPGEQAKTQKTPPKAGA